jgi:hypothetical protein
MTAAKEKDRQTRTATFTRALQNMKTIAEGGTLPPAPPRGGGAPAGDTSRERRPQQLTRPCA